MQEEENNDDRLDRFESFHRHDEGSRAPPQAGSPSALSLDEPMPYVNADCEINGQIHALIKQMAADGTAHLIAQYGDAVK